MLLYLDELLETKKLASGTGTLENNAPITGGDFNGHYPLQNRLSSIGSDGERNGSDGELDTVSYSDVDAEGITIGSELGEQLLDPPGTFENQVQRHIEKQKEL